MNDVKIFENPEFGRVRTTVIDGEPWFVAVDVCHALDIGNPSDALNRLDDDERTLVSIEGASNGKPVNGVNEPGLYSLVLGSRKPEAKAFKRWITHEVIPAIRKTGGYHVPQSPAEQMAQGLLAAQKLLAEKDKRIEEMRPKEIFADAVTASKTSILVGGLAKLIKQQGIDIGQKRLFAWMRENGFLIKSGTEKNMPTQRAMDMKLFEVKEGSFVDGNGVNRITRTTKVTGKGQVYFVNKFLNGSKAVLE
ncbi:phage antirepressor KilAC domain-containing protein [Mitsuokella jalaludinii]|uniref:phage antirepressor n=1 Tax=Mitsuokella jalaludinii TaxID=187979 RepID=UPI00259954EF|nr:phage antirepressor KilAC domain-containing protein [uncultured Mitsuokella sp.]